MRRGLIQLMVVLAIMCMCAIYVVKAGVAMTTLVEELPTNPPTLDCSVPCASTQTLDLTNNNNPR